MYPYTALLDHASGIWEYMDTPVIILSDPSEVTASIKHFLEDSIQYVQEMVQEGKMLPKYSLFHEYSRIALDCKRIKEDPFIDNISNIHEVNIPNETLDVRLKMINTPEKNVLALNEKEIERVIHTCMEEHIPYQMIDAENEIKDGINIYLADYMQGFQIGIIFMSIQQVKSLKFITIAEDMKISLEMLKFCITMKIFHQETISFMQRMV